MVDAEVETAHFSLCLMHVKPPDDHWQQLNKYFVCMHELHNSFAKVNLMSEKVSAN